MVDRVLDPVYVERAAEVVRRAAGLWEGVEFEAVRWVFEVRELVAQVALALALEAAEAGGAQHAAPVQEGAETFGEAAAWLREHPDLVVDDSGWAEVEGDGA